MLNEFARFVVYSLLKLESGTRLAGAGQSVSFPINVSLSVIFSPRFSGLSRRSAPAPPRLLLLKPQSRCCG